MQPEEQQERTDNSSGDCDRSQPRNVTPTETSLPRRTANGGNEAQGDERTKVEKERQGRDPAVTQQLLRHRRGGPEARSRHKRSRRTPSCRSFHPRQFSRVPTRHSTAPLRRAI